MVYSDLNRCTHGPLPVVSFAVLGTVLAAAGQAQEPRLLERLTLADALVLAARQNPTLAAQEQTVEVARAGEITASLRPNPAFQNDTTSATIGVYQEIEIGGKRRAREESARLGTAVARSDSADAHRTLELEVRRAFFAALLAREGVALATENAAGFRRVVEANRVRLERGAESGADLLKVELQMLQYDTDLQDARLALQTARAELRELLGGGSGLVEDFEVEGDLRPAPFDRPLADLQRDALAHRPDLASAEAGVEKAAADVRLAKVNAWPDPTIGASLLHTGREISGPDWFQPFYPKGETSNAMGLGVAFPIPLFNRNQGEIARTRAEQLRASLLERAARNQVLRDVETDYAALQSSRERVRMYEETYLARSRESREIAEYAFERGATSILELLDAERTDRATQLAYRRELAAYRTNLAELEAAVGAPLQP